MAEIFNRAYDQANRMLNTSGLSSIVYRKEGGKYSYMTPGMGLVDAYKNLPSTAKMFINAITGKENITDQNVSEYFSKEDLSTIAELADKNQRLVEEGYFNEECHNCFYSEENLKTKKVCLGIDFKDGNHENFKIDNLRFLCPNCYLSYNGYFPKSKSFCK